MKFSIITASYNRSATLARALNSVRAQTYPNKEMVIVDGASTDGSIEVIKSFIGSTDVLISEADKGIYDALNKGINLSSGDIIGVLHSDDCFSDHNVLSEVAEIFRSNSVDLVYGDASFFSEKEPEKVTRIYKSGPFSRDRLCDGFMPAHTAMFFRKRVFEKYGLYKTTYKIAADYEFLCRVVSKDIRYEYFPKVLVKMQSGGASNKNLLTTITLNKEVLRACADNNLNTNIFRVLLKYPHKLLGLLRRNFGA